MIKTLPQHFYVGLFVMACAWVVSWTKLTPFSYYTFIFLWGGFIFVLDGLNVRLTGSSLYTRNRRWFWLLFIVSAIFWWYFEVVVMIVKNWYYLTDRATVSILEHQLLGSIYFSTVIPAVLEMAELINNLHIFPARTHSFKLKNWGPRVFVFLGIVSLVLPVFLPQFFFPLIWSALFFLFDAYNYHTGAASLLHDAQTGQWSRAIKLAAAALLCGLAWEMWNYYADPQWIYDVPFVGVLKVFEMPVLGFLGYIPFGWEVFAVYVFARNVMRKAPLKYFELEDALHHQLNKVRASTFIKMIMFLILFLVPVVTIEDRLWQQFYGIPLTKIEQGGSFLPVADWYNGVSGVTNWCVLGITLNHCVVTADHQTYMLLNAKGDLLRTEIGKRVWIQGAIDFKQNEAGLGEIRIHQMRELN